MVTASLDRRYLLFSVPYRFESGHWPRVSVIREPPGLAEPYWRWLPCLAVQDPALAWSAAADVVHERVALRHRIKIGTLVWANSPDAAQLITAFRDVVAHRLTDL
jgi:hypothetical protein